MKLYLIVVGVVFSLCFGNYFGYLVASNTIMETKAQLIFAHIYLFSLGGVIYFLVVRKAIVHALSLSKKKMLLFFACGMFFAILNITLLSDVLFNLHIPTKVRIVATGDKNQESNGSEVWITKISEDDRQVDLSELQLPIGWEYREGAILSYQLQPAEIDITLNSKNTASISILKHGWSGIAEITQADVASTVDLFATEAGEYLYKVNIEKGSFLNAINLLRILQMVILFFILFVLLTYIITTKKYIAISLVHSFYIIYFISKYIAYIDVISLLVLFIIDSILVYKYVKVYFVKEYRCSAKVNKILNYIISVFLSVMLSVIIWNFGIYKVDNFFNIIYSIAFLCFTSALLYFVIHPLFIKLTNDIKSNIIDTNLSNRNISKKYILVYALPCLVFWGIGLLILYPGLMSPDSIDQWIQKSNFIFNDWHPILHTLYICLLTYLWNSPAAVSLFQVIAFSSIFGYGMYVLRKAGVKHRVLLLMSFIFALYPPNMIYSITLWKDIPYAFLILMLTILLFKIYNTNGALLKNNISMTGFGILLAAVGLFRHNGIVVVIGVYFMLLILFKEHYKRTIYCLLLTIIMMYFVKVPLYNALQVEKSPAGLKFTFYMQQIAAVIKYDGDMNEKEKEKISRIVDEEYIKANYRKYTIDGLVFSGKPYVQGITDNIPTVINLYLALFKKNANIMLISWLNLTDQIWNIFEPQDGYVMKTAGLPNQMLEYMKISPDKYPELVTRNWNAITEQLLKILRGIPKNSIIYILVWRHGIYMFLGFFMVISLIMKGKNYKSLIVFVPIVSNVASLMISNAAQDFRYVYPTHVCFAFLLLYYLMQLNNKEPISINK